MGLTRDTTSNLFTSTTVTSPGTFTITFSVNPTAGSSVVVALGINGNGVALSVVSVKDNGTTQSTFTADAVKTGTPNHVSWIYRADGISLPASGTYSITVTLSGTSTGVSVSAGAASYLGKASGGPVATSTGTATGTAITTNSATPTLGGSLFFATFQDNSSGSADNPTVTNGNFTQQLSEGNGNVAQVFSMADAIEAGTSADACTWSVATSATYSSALAVYSPVAATVVSGAANMTGAGTLGATGSDVKPGAASLAGAGTLGVTGWQHGYVTGLTGDGEFGGTATVINPGAGSAALSGSGTLGAVADLTFAETAGLTGFGSLSALATGTRLYVATLSGAGTLGVAHGQSYVTGLTGFGSLVIPQVAGGLVNGVGGVGTPLALPGTSQVAVAPPGSNAWQWLGTLGQVTALKYSYNCPGGCDKMSTTIMVPASFRTQLFNPGWQVKIVRGAHDVWHGKLDEPQPSAQGWNLTAVGTGNRGQDFLAYYAIVPWPNGEPDEILNRAIARGLPWANPGFNGSPYFSQFWFGQQVDPGAQTVSAFLNLLCTRGGLTWYVNSQPGGIYNSDDLSIFPLPTVVNRLLVVDTPVARTLSGDVNYILIKYQVSADNTTTNQAATYGFVAAVNQQSIDAHQEMETFIDLSDVGVQSSAQAQAVGNYVLQIYQRASFAGPFQASYGQLLNAGGVPIDPGTDQAGTYVRLILTDYGYGGEVTPQFPIEFITGSYEWDDFAQVATVTPYQTVDQSLTGLLSLQNTLMVPIKAAGP